MGSGTTQAAAMKLGRLFLGCDINYGAIQIATKRLVGISAELKKKMEQPELGENEEYYTGFEVYTVNHYDIFRNPVQAKELLLQALEITPTDRASTFDGTKDEYNVKLMPINRIATRADISDLIANLDYKSLEKRYEDNPNAIHERVMLVCMGHEPDLAAHFKKETSRYRIDVKVLDILKDGQELVFKYPSEAELKIDENNLLVNKFYPLTLLQKLSYQKENVEEWRELVESIMIDPYYDGNTFSPTIHDIPEKKEFVVGEYELPNDRSIVAIKITDLLSETHFEVLE
jgi:site-specific DNA-methyltransferase (adenine-specific)/adenine-specific DNA-methyltransferase